MHEYRTLIKGNLSELHNLSSEFKVESLKVDALKSAILDYKSIMSRYSEIDLLITRKFSKQRYTDDPSKCEKYVKEIKTAQSEIEKLEKDLEKIENNVKNEYVWFTADRNQHIEDSINSIVLSQRSRFLMESEFWLNKKHETLKL